MNIIDLPIAVLTAAPWNPNHLDEAGFERLKNSLSRYALVQPLVVRPIQGLYEVLSGNQRLRVLTDLSIDPVPCVVVELDDAEAKLLAQALNGLHGTDDLALKGALLKEILSAIPESEVLSLLPETSDSLNSLSTINEGTLAEHLEAWQQAQAAKLSHMQLQFTKPQLETVQEALTRILPIARDSKKDNPNTRGTAMYLLCKFYLERYQPE
ncbi:ParB/RepB/Spo0J family partition protein [Dehalogenimonas alkenigignens]|uniref:ParB/RepB/Spo0J family partition protein n=1 Tax=Dehalogenimonas alkenigignens TaxID=1217799 RepID=UPI000D579712|nr:ParB/RepB/Spo0J family partition protein [Dehalogenimonas alkenigignens]PVV82979.1 chromosome partitioning protein ParB [Dehalogenimonas alkenigignens]